ncbi:Uncharacterised protein [Serratia rubidaea]|uniref:Cardiolipin synthase YbhO n=1 Tax=Serratia rubidaea TaxID=61652 RepID=A0A3S5DFA6_SERRU|nr:Uncharacterised protein [Serratia rubidaea]
MNVSHHAANARFEVPGYELVYSAPLETQLQNDDLRDSAEVWRQMFAQARQRIDIAQFYVMNRPGSRLDAVLAELRRAGERGVQIRLLLERKGCAIRRRIRWSSWRRSHSWNCACSTISR